MPGQNSLYPNFACADRIWFTADTHFCHSNIINHCHRPFADVAEMNEKLIRNWNQTVPEDGIVFHLGDFCSGDPGEWNDIISRLHGTIYLILGNHDMRFIKGSFMKKFARIEQQMTICVDRQRIILNHYPLLCYAGSYDGVWQLFGHVHSGPNRHIGSDIPRLSSLFPRQYDVGVDNNGYRPVSFLEVKEKIVLQLTTKQTV